MGSCVVLVVTREEATVTVQEYCVQHDFYYEEDVCSVPDLWGRFSGTIRIQTDETLDQDQDKEGCRLNYIDLLKKG